MVGLTAKIFVEIARLNDKIHMAEEILRTAGAWMLCAREYRFCENK